MNSIHMLFKVFMKWLFITHRHNNLLFELEIGKKENG